MPKVSVVIPIFNGAATVAEAVESALAQTFRDFEVIAVNDGSTDGTLEVLASYRDRIKIISRPNGGISAARNTGVAESSGEYLAFLDCDDIWKPEFLTRAVAALDADRECVLAFADVQLIDSDGQPLDTRLANHAAGQAPTLAAMFERLWPIMPSAVVMRRIVFERIGGFSEKFRGVGYEDVWMWMLAREKGPFAYIAEPLVKWRFALFPRPLKIRRPPTEAGRIFAQLAHERWNVDVRPLLRSREHAYRSILGYIGLLALRSGDSVTARRAFAVAIRLDPRRVRNYLRYGRTFLPATMARALSGGTGRTEKHIR
ncbi:MAG: glycosyl transferase [Candidatus Binatus sp.]|nr:glycosyl transferase [Candidatus Binatus sp.]